MKNIFFCFFTHIVYAKTGESVKNVRFWLSCTDLVIVIKKNPEAQILQELVYFGRITNCMINKHNYRIQFAVEV